MKENCLSLVFKAHGQKRQQLKDVWQKTGFIAKIQRYT
jgi:hypothetical protein